MRKIDNITSIAMMLVVLLLGVLVPSLPDLDDDDDNVGCAAVMTLAAPKTGVRNQAAQERLRQSTPAEKHIKARSFASLGRESAPAQSLAHVSPPLRA
jgi:hypothetical protein